jgi:hypothetical protein
MLDVPDIGQYDPCLALQGPPCEQVPRNRRPVGSPKYRAGLIVAVCNAASGVMPPRTKAPSSSCT